MKRVAFHTLGCKLNYAETAAIGKQFLQHGFEVVDLDDGADVCVINTCSVTERADRECRQVIRRALRKSPDAYIIVAGCYAQLAPNEVVSMPGVSLVLGAKEKFALFRYVDGFEKKSRPQIAISEIDTVNDFGPAYSGGFGERTRAFLKVQDGCDFNCSFCTIPLARGVSRSQSVDETVAQARSLVSQGYKEIVLTGVNVGDYGKKVGTNLVSLLKALVSVDDLKRIRISSIEPNLLSDELVTMILSSEKICNHLHIPLQSGSDSVLKRMRRRYLTAQYRKVVEIIRKQCPDAGIGADVIVGFPGETDALFEETYQLLLDLPVTYLHVFTYSERPNTDAPIFGRSVEPRIRSMRSKMLRILSKKKKRQFYETSIGRTLPVLFEAGLEGGKLVGWTGNYIRVGIKPDDKLVNQVVPVGIYAVDGDTCLGEPFHNEQAHAAASIPPVTQISVQAVEAV
ncbi:MAG: tRNA (N(6)-L-threonylcarbamoyladenosine(37)-C(2))-methylthiotransferase MtaB [Bacteroidota bacterium]